MNDLIKNLFRAGLVYILAMYASPVSAQAAFDFSVYLEPYYSFDGNRPTNHERPYAYAFNRHNEVNLNFGYIKGSYETTTVRANLALATGTYMNANYAAEPGVLQNIYEANAGIKLSKHKNIWVDAGIMPSHIGFESAEGKSCVTLSRGLAAENSPYFETGTCISYESKNGKWYVAALLLNGWQRIQRVAANNTPAFGHQLTYKPNHKVTLNSSSFVGNDKPDTARQMRYFHNLYGIFKFSRKLELTAGLDIGAEQKAFQSKDYAFWYAPTLILQYSPDMKQHIALRGEYYQDPHGIIVSTAGLGSFNCWGYSVNYDYDILPQVSWRIEARRFTSAHTIFQRDNRPVSSDFVVTTSLAVKF